MSAAVYFFGGWQASQPDMTLWLKTAQTQQSGIDFTAFPYPIASPNGEAAANGFKNVDAVVAGGKSRFKDLDAVVAAIKASTADRIYIVGHSSGCAIANRVENGLKFKDKKDYDKIFLRALDGYTPSGTQQHRSNTQIWVAKSFVGKKLFKSLHYDDLQGVLGYQEHTAGSNCTEIIALHFSLVNSNSNDTDVGKSIPNGYAKCNANLMWL